MTEKDRDFNPNMERQPNKDQEYKNYWIDQLEKEKNDEEFQENWNENSRKNYLEQGVQFIVGLGFVE